MKDAVSNDETAPSKVNDSFERILETLTRRVKLIAICTIVGTVSAVGFSLLQEKQYTASASLLFRDPQFAQSVFGTDAQSFASVDATRQAATNLVLASLKTVSQRTATVMTDSELTADDIDSAIEVTAQGESDVVSVSATALDPETARSLADTFARQFIVVRANADKDKLLLAKQLADREFSRLDPAEQVGPRGEQLSRGAEKLGILASLQTGNAELVQTAELPTSPSSPKTARNALVGLMTGLLLGIGLAFLAERLDRRLRKPEDAEEAFGLPVLGSIPQSKTLGKPDSESRNDSLPFAESEAFRMVRASLRYFSIDHDIQTVLIVSERAGEGKSTVSWNLASVAALTSRVLLVETDLRRPRLATKYGLTPGPGLAELLTHQVALDDVIQNVTQTHSAARNDKTGDEEGRLDVVVGGFPPPNPAELLESESITTIISGLRGQYDLILMDSAPIGVVSDALPLAKYADGVLLVTRLDQSTRDSARRLKETLLRSQAQLLGIIANCMRTGRLSKYGYGNPSNHGYGYNAYGDNQTIAYPPKGSRDVEE